MTDLSCTHEVVIKQVLCFLCVIISFSPSCQMLVEFLKLMLDNTALMVACNLLHYLVTDRELVD